MYSDNDFRLYHSAKGSTWKNHKYVSKKTSGGKTQYRYSRDLIGFKTMDELDKETQKLNEYKESFNSEKEAADRMYEQARAFDENGNPIDNPAADLLYKGAGHRYGALYDYGSHGTYSPGTRELSDQANRVAQLRNQYNNTLLGKAEKHIAVGAKVLRNAFESISNIGRNANNGANKVMDDPVARTLLYHLSL